MFVESNESMSRSVRSGTTTSIDPRNMPLLSEPKLSGSNAFYKHRAPTGAGGAATGEHEFNRDINRGSRPDR